MGIDSLVEVCGISIVNTMELPQSGTKPSIQYVTSKLFSFSNQEIPQIPVHRYLNLLQCLQF